MAKRRKIPNNDGKYFEGKSQKIISSLNPGKDVKRDVRIAGKFSEYPRQVDIVLRDPGEFDFIAYECKDEKRSIGIPTVEAYITKLKDVGAKRGAIVSNSPFARGARRMAARHDVDLLNLVDTADPAIKTKLFANALMVNARVNQWKTGFKNEPSENSPLRLINWQNLIITNPINIDIPILEFANTEWNKVADIPNVKTGTYTGEINGFITMINGRRISLDGLLLTFEIEVERRIGQLDITQSTGIYNVKNGSYQTQSLAMGEIGIEIYQGWQLVTDSDIESQHHSVILCHRSDLRISTPQGSSSVR